MTHAAPPLPLPAVPARSATPRRVALVHDWLTGMRGGERALEAICELFPDATRFALIHVPGSVSATIEARPIHTSFLQRLPLSHRYFRPLLPLFPAAVEQFDLDDFDLIISTSHCAAKSVVPPGRARHLCYCFTPMRYAWDQFGAYFGPDRVGAGASRFFRWGLSAMARWDASTANRVDRYLAISQYVAGRIRRYYNRDASIVYPPVDTTFFRPSGKPPGASLLIVSALVPYKRVDLAIRACALAGARLRIVGKGPELVRLRELAGPNVEFLGALSDEQVRTEYQEAGAVMLPGIEDFGIGPVEAQACGRPVVALGQGGACETVVDGVTGVLVPEPTETAFAAAIERVQRSRYDASTIRQHALGFSRERFQVAFTQQVEQLMTVPKERVAQ
ncbi:MAG: glycosyl transferase family 1 [Acidobacteria bacterium]|nr:glycosyl transferase family 1 [Acidobacteriota bacterium]MDP7340182.1 glycosyltransferase [Vicinamibacterales bacterium]MDP7479226.1 glycosyltransferase [Vicinamibacterales bacterium]